jgi:hypothetical protein
MAINFATRLPLIQYTKTSTHFKLDTKLAQEVNLIFADV